MYVFLRNIMEVLFLPSSDDILSQKHCGGENEAECSVFQEFMFLGGIGDVIQVKSESWLVQLPFNSSSVCEVKRASLRTTHRFLGISLQRREEDHCDDEAKDSLDSVNRCF